MTSESHHDEAYVWVWLPGRDRAGGRRRRADAHDGLVSFNYGRSFLELRWGAIPLYLSRSCRCSPGNCRCSPA